MNSREFGKQGEGAVASLLEQRGLEILGRNVYAGHCEIDVLARSETHILFVEVKSRRALPGLPDRFGRPANAVTRGKQAHLLTGATRWLFEHRDLQGERRPRIDVAEVYISPIDDSVLRIDYIENAVRRK